MNRPKAGNVKLLLSSLPDFKDLYVIGSCSGCVNASSPLSCSCWSSSLDNAMKRHTEKSNKHWFSIYQLINKYLQDQRLAAPTGMHTVHDSAYMQSHPHDEPLIQSFCQSWHWNCWTFLFLPCFPLQMKQWNSSLWPQCPLPCRPS